MTVKHVNKNLELIGAFFVHSTVPDDWPENIQKVMKKANKEMTSTLADTQYDLYLEAGAFKVTLESS